MSCGTPHSGRSPPRAASPQLERAVLPDGQPTHHDVARGVLRLEDPRVRVEVVEHVPQQLVPPERRLELQHRAPHREALLLRSPLQLERRGEGRLGARRRGGVVGREREVEDVRALCLVEQLKLEAVEGRADVAQRAPPDAVELTHQLLVERRGGQWCGRGLRTQQPLQQVAQLDEELVGRRAAAQPLLQGRLVPRERRPEGRAPIEACGRGWAGGHDAQGKVALAHAQVAAERAVGVCVRDEERLCGAHSRRVDRAARATRARTSKTAGGGG